MGSGLTRREMLVRMGTMIGLAALPPVVLRSRSQAQTALSGAFVSLNSAEGATLRAIVARIIPSDDNGPGALEARADRFIDRALGGALKNQRQTYAAGLSAVDAYAQSSKGAPFAKLSAADQDAVLLDMQQDRATGFTGQSSQFFNLARAHTIQGTFSDPFYGGNEKFIGWDLIGYPGARMVVSANMQRMDVKAEPSRKSAYDYGMFNKGEI